MSQDAALTGKFKAVYANAVTSENIMDAIATFERSLVTPSRFDRYLRGDGAVSSILRRLGTSVFNSSFNFRQLWGGGASSLEDQIDKVIKNPKVFNSSWPEIISSPGVTSSRQPKLTRKPD